MNPSDLVEEQYLDWLIYKIGGDKYRSLCEQLYKTSFIWFIPNDDNRDEDGRQLRSDFLDEVKVYPFGEWRIRDCSVLELILGVAHRLSYDSNINSDDWFWELITNLGLLKYNDASYDRTTNTEVNKIIRKLNNRTYKRDGSGGLFPLSNHNEDQRKVEIWYQMSSYLLENNLMA